MQFSYLISTFFLLLLFYYKKVSWTLYYVDFLIDLDAEENQNIIETLRGKVREKLKNAKVMLFFLSCFHIYYLLQYIS